MKSSHLSHLQLLPLNTAFQQAINLDIIEYTHGLQTPYQQNLMSLGRQTEIGISRASLPRQLEVGGDRLIYLTRWADASDS